MPATKRKKPLKASTYAPVQNLYERVWALVRASEKLSQLQHPLVNDLRLALSNFEAVAVEQDSKLGKKAKAAAIELADNPSNIDRHEIRIWERDLVHHNGEDGWWVPAEIFISDLSLKGDDDADNAGPAGPVR